MPKKATYRSARRGSADAEPADIRAQACRAFNTVHEDTAVSLFERVLDLGDHVPSAADRESRRRELIGLLADFKPRDSTERILAANIVAAHTVAMDRLQLASAADRTEQQRNAAFDQAMRAQKGLTQLIAQYDRRRARAIPPMVSSLVTESGRDHIIFVDEPQQKARITPQEAREYLVRLATKYDVATNRYEEIKATEKP